MKMVLLASLLAAMMLSSCQREGKDSIAEVSGRLFVFNYRVATATYLVTLKRIAPVAEHSAIEAEFENPRGGPPLSLEKQIFPAADRIVLESPHVQCVRKDQPYAVTIRLKGPDGAVLQTIETSVTSDTDQSILPRKPLVVGPGYARNPDVFHADGSMDMGPVADCPGQ